MEKSLKQFISLEARADNAQRNNFDCKKVCAALVLHYENTPIQIH